MTKRGNGQVPAMAPLLTAKQTIPPERPSGVVRSRCSTVSATTHATRLTVVAAPAGWGKTTLLSQWANDPAEVRRIAWVSHQQARGEQLGE